MLQYTTISNTVAVARTSEVGVTINGNGFSKSTQFLRGHVSFILQNVTEQHESAITFFAFLCDIGN